MTDVLFTCSGLSNTGRLTTETALTLMHRMPGRFVWIKAREAAESLGDELGYADKVLVIDGCTDCCAMKIYSASFPTRFRHIVATEFGIMKNGMADVQYHEIERMIQEILSDGVGPE